MKSRCPTPYIEKSARHRRNRFVAKRWRIRTDSQAPDVFFSWHAIPGTRVWNSIMGGGDSAIQTHAHIHFLSRIHAHQGWWYRARVSTVEQAAAEALEDLVSERMDEMGPSRGAETWRRFRDLWGAVAPPDWESLNVSIGASCDFTDPQAVGLNMVLAEDNLDVSTLKAAVISFWESGEQAASHPIDWAVHRKGVEAMVASSVALYDRLLAATLDR